MMDKNVYLITGISSGLGKALANTIIEAGHYVVGTFRNEEQVSNFNMKHGQNAEAVLLDVTDAEAIDKTINHIISKHGKIDCLINNAGIGFSGAIEEASLEEVRKIFETNFFGVAKITQSVLPHMRNRRHGNIVQISSHAGVKAFAGFGIYNASKFALEGYSEALAQEVEPLGIKVTIVEPGPFRTNFAGRSLVRAKNQIDDYSETAGIFKTTLDNKHNKQEGDPDKAAKIILEHISSKNSTLRLPLGSVPMKTINMKIESLKSDLELNRDKAMKAIF